MHEMVDSTMSGMSNPVYLEVPSNVLARAFRPSERIRYVSQTPPPLGSVCGGDPLSRSAADVPNSAQQSELPILPVYWVQVAGKEPADFNPVDPDYKELAQTFRIPYFRDGCDSLAASHQSRNDSRCEYLQEVTSGDVPTFNEVRWPDIDLATMWPKS